MLSSTQLLGNEACQNVLAPEPKTMSIKLKVKARKGKIQIRIEVALTPVWILL